MDKKILIPVFLLALVLMIAFFVDSILHNYSDEPVESDAIIILGGGDQGRVQQAADLYASGYADSVIITPVGDRFNTEELISVVRHYGVDEEDIIVDSESTSTHTNAEQSIQAMNDRNFDSALVVTSDYHLKRAKLSFDRLNGGAKEFNYIPSTNLAGESWYDRENALDLWFNETVKVWGYRFGLYHFVG